MQGPILPVHENFIKLCAILFLGIGSNLLVQFHPIRFERLDDTSVSHLVAVVIGKFLPEVSLRAESPTRNDHLDGAVRVWSKNHERRGAYLPQGPVTLQTLPFTMKPRVNPLPVHNRYGNATDGQHRVTLPVGGSVVPHLVEKGEIFGERDCWRDGNVLFREL